MPTSFNSTIDQLGKYWEAAIGAGYPEIGVHLMRTAEAKATLRDRETLADIWAAPGSVNLEANFTDYVVKVLANPTRTVDDAGDQVLLGGDPVGTARQIKWDLAGGTTNNTLVRVLYTYIPTSGAPASEILPLYSTPTPIGTATDGNDLILIIHPDGIARVKNAT